MDEDQEDALRSAFAALKDEERRAAADSAATGGFESDSLQSLSKLGFELRSFVQGARDALQRVQTAVVNRALLDARLAVQTAEYVLRRAAFDTGLVLEAGAAWGEAWGESWGEAWGEAWGEGPGTNMGLVLEAG